jgi:hypothetical protein
MGVAKFPVQGEGHTRFNGAIKATVLIDRKNGLITVRPFRQHSAYTLPLSDVAAIIVERCIKADVQAAKPARAFRAKRSTL